MVSECDNLYSTWVSGRRRKGLRTKNREARQRCVDKKIKIFLEKELGKTKGKL
jgi:hypothetical protein